MRHLKWLALLGFLGILGWVTEYQGLGALFVFFVFLPLFGFDERKEAVYKQAATNAFIVTTFTLAGTFLYMTLARIRVPDEQIAGYLLSTFAMGWAIIYIIHVLVFVLSYVYYEVRGFRQ